MNRRILFSCLSILVLSRLVVAGGTGPYSPTATAWTATQKQQQRAAAVTLMANLKAAIDSYATSYSIPKGDYRFAEPSGTGSHLDIKNASNMVIDGNGSTFWFESGNAGMTLVDSTNVTIKNLVLDWDPLPFVQGTITTVTPILGSSNFNVTIVLDSGYQNVTHEFKDLVNDSATRSYLSNSSGLRFQVVDPATGRFKKGTVGMRCNPFLNGTTGTGPFTTTVYPFVSGLPSGFHVAPGDRFVCMYRHEQVQTRTDGSKYGVGQGHAVQSIRNSNCTFENIVLHAAPFIGFYETQTENRTTYTGCRIVPDGDTNRLLGGNADGINITDAKQGPLIQYCDIESIGDDFVNSHGYYYRVLEKTPGYTDNKHYTVDLMASRGVIPGTVALNFLARNTWANLGTINATVTSQLSWNYQTSSDPIWLTATNWKSGGRGSAPGANGNWTYPAHKIVLDTAIDLPDDSVFSCDTFCSNGATLQYNRFINGLATGVRLQAANSQVLDNYLEWTANNLFQLQTQPDQWGESTYPDGSVVSRNLLISPNQFALSLAGTSASAALLSPGTLSQARLINNVQYTNNIFRDVPLTALRIQGGTNTTVQNNRIESYGTAVDGDFVSTPPSSTTPLGYGLYLLTSSGTTNTGNTFSGAGSRAGNAVQTVP